MFTTNNNSNTSISQIDQPLSREQQGDLLREALPQCQPQEGSPPNTFTQSELDDLKRALPNLQIGPRASAVLNKQINEDANNNSINNNNNNNNNINKASPTTTATNTIDICDEHFFIEPDPPQPQSLQDGMYEAEAPPQDGSEEYNPVAAKAKEQEDVSTAIVQVVERGLDWHGAPRLHKQVSLARKFRSQVRSGNFVEPTNGVCPGFMQCNLVVLPQGQHAFDFLLFCQRNPKCCPLIEVCDVGSPFPTGVAMGADLRTDVPK
jgi:hypothetical protein